MSFYVFPHIQFTLTLFFRFLLVCLLFNSAQCFVMWVGKLSLASLKPLVVYLRVLRLQSSEFSVFDGCSHVTLNKQGLFVVIGAAPFALRELVKKIKASILPVYCT